MNKLLFLDLETNGLPLFKYGKYYKYNELEGYENARVLSICMKYIVNLENTGQYSLELYNIIKPDFNIGDSYKIHGITKEIAEEKGVEWDTIIETIIEYINNADVIVGHNINFDINVLASELFRRGYEDISKILIKKHTYCTMLNGVNITKILKENPKNETDYKKPKLIELYKYLFNEEIEGAHNAKVDVEACERCYYNLISK